MCFLRDVLFCEVGRCGDDDADDDDADDDDSDDDDDAGDGGVVVIFSTVVKCANISVALFRPSIRSKKNSKKKKQDIE